MVHHDFHPIPVKRFRPQVEKATDRFLLNLSRSPEPLLDSLRQSVLVRFIMRIQRLMTLFVQSGCYDHHDDSLRH